MTMQTLARVLEGKAIQVRSRNEETTQKFVDRLSPGSCKTWRGRR
jgi:hypothetical protein